MWPLAFYRQVKMTGFLILGFNFSSGCYWPLIFGLLTGGYTSTMLDAKQSLAAILFGNAFPMLLIVPITLYFARYGIDTFVGFQKSLGI